MLKMACHLVLGADVETAGNKNNGGHHEEHTTDLFTYAELAIPKRPSALDWEECPYATPLLSQTDRKCPG
jgi:hypothetical protein